MYRKYIICILSFFWIFLLHAQKQNSNNWVYMGKVNAVYEIRKTREKNEDYANKISEKAFLYSSFDGEKMIYKLYLPIAEKTYDVMTSPSYTGEDIKWSHNGKNIIHIPSLYEMYSHYAGPYHFNVTSVEEVN